jgi:hypothetical protein
VNARRARQARQLRRRDVEQLLEEAASSTPRLVGTHAGQEMWATGPVLHVIPALRDDYPGEIKAAIDLRRRAALSGVCDCGGRWDLDRHGLLGFGHEPGCPAIDDVLFELGHRHGYTFSRWSA